MHQPFPWCVHLTPHGPIPNPYLPQQNGNRELTMTDTERQIAVQKNYKNKTVNAFQRLESLMYAFYFSVPRHV